MISVVVPVHNTFLYIKECIDSILNQTYKDLEVICIDSSTDDTTILLKKIAETDSRVRVILDPNSSYGYKVNTGIKLAQGDYISIVDSDDYLELNMYKRLLEVIEENDADFVKSDHSSFYVENGENIIFEYMTNSSDKELYGRCSNCSANPSILYKTGISIWTGLYKKAFLLENEICMNESEGASFQDAGFSILTHVYGKRIFYLNESFYRYRTDNANSSVKSQKKYRTIADEWNWIDNQLKNRGMNNRDIWVALGARKMMNYEWNEKRLDEDTSKEFLKSINKELVEQYLLTSMAEDMPERFYNIFTSIYEKGALLVQTQEVLDILKNGRVILIGVGEQGQKILSYDFANRYFGIQKIYDLTEGIVETEGFYINVGAVSSQIAIKDHIYLIADDGDEHGKQLIEKVQLAGIDSEKIYVCSHFNIPEFDKPEEI